MIFVRNLTGWLILWYASWYGWIFLLRRGFNHVTTYRITALYFIVLSFVVWYFYYTHLSLFFLSLPLRMIPIIMLAIFFICIFGIYHISHEIFNKSILASHLQKRIPSATMDYRFLISKSFDILFQQIAFLSLLLIMHNVFSKSASVIMMSGLIFGMTHIPLFFTKHNALAKYFVIASFFAGSIFSFLILTLPYGFIYAYMLHWGFYLFVGMSYNLRKLRSKKVALIKE